MNERFSPLLPSKSPNISFIHTCVFMCVCVRFKTQTKATSQKLVPTITCTSSNVVQTILQAFAQVPGLNVFYGPDTYMGRNLRELFQSMVHWSDEEIKGVHPLHSRATLQELLPKFHIFEDGTCIVHHIFGEKVHIRINKFLSLFLHYPRS